MHDQPKHPRQLPARQRIAISVASEQWGRFEEVQPGVRLPVVVRPAARGVDLPGWIASHQALVDARIHDHGAVLFRGFDITTAAAFDEVIRALSGAALSYEERSSPRSQVSGNIYTSTDHPADQHIFLHNEQSYNLAFPLRIVFCCVTPSATGGETPLADVRRVFARLAPDVRQRFIERGYAYARTFSPHFGLSWQTAFQTDDRAEVTAYCRRNGIEMEWRDGDRLRTWQVRRVAGLHPVTTEPVWFNHATFFHVSTLAAEVAEALVSQLGEHELPNNTYYGDGAVIEPEVLDALRAAYRAETVRFPWRRGDVLAIDNMLVAHGRTPFTGTRLVMAGMARPFPWDQVAQITQAAPPG
jgi:alpha-ketoglutarate-dependent taurine dioxygenase